MTRLYIVRHAEAVGNKTRVFHGRTDADVSDKGLRQLSRLRERFKTIDYDTAYSSPLKRAYMTAQAANFYHNKPINIRDDLIEINGGHWENTKWSEIPVLYPEDNHAWIYEPWKFAPEGGETMHEVYDRIWNAMLSIVKENIGKRVLVASHGCAIRNFICRAQGLPLESIRDVPWFENTSISTVDFDDELKAHIVSMNDASHLDSELATLANQDWWKKCQTSGVD